MKKIITLLVILFITIQSHAQFSTFYENSFRNWQPGQGWVFLNNDTLLQTPGLVTSSYNGEVYDYMLGMPLTNAQGDKVMFSPPIALNGNPWLTFYSKHNPSTSITAWIASNENDTTLTGLTDSLTIGIASGFNVVDLSAFNNDTVRFAFRIEGNPVSGVIDNIRILNRHSLAWLPDSCFRNYMKSVIPLAFVGDSLDYLRTDALNRTQIINPHSCVQSLEGLQYFQYIRYIDLRNNLVSYIPMNELYYLDSMNFENNLLTSLPDVPICTVLKLDNNLLQKIPDINNQQVSFFHARNNMIFDCLQPSNRFVSGDFYNNIHVYFVPSYYYSNPNFYSGMTPIPNCTQTIGRINGTAYYDVNQDSVYNAGDFLCTGLRLDYLQGPDLFTTNAGAYSITTDTGLINLHANSLPSWFDCVNHLDDTLGIQEQIQHDFRIIATGSAHDVAVTVTSSSRAVLNDYLIVNVNVRNYGTSVTSTDVKMYLPPCYSYITLSGGSIVNDTLYWTPTIDPLTSLNNRVYMWIDTFPSPLIYPYIAMVDSTNDARPDNNIDTCKVRFAYPCDPNNKTVSDSIVTPGFNEYLTYTINFENIGSANATHVTVKDYLSSELDPQTFEFIASSHPCTISMGNDSLLQFTFYPITLTPKSIDSLHCDGHIWFRIKPRNSVQIGDTITNVAQIYFDTQPAVITQECNVWADTSVILSSHELTTSDPFIFPNPTKGFINIINDFKDISQIAVINSLGQTVRIFTDKKPVNNSMQIDIKDLPEGMYFIVIYSEYRIQTSRILKQN